MQENTAREEGYLLSCDFDGTLYNNREIKEEDKKAIKQSLESGAHMFMINTGRTLAFLQKDLGNLAEVVDYYSCSNGGIIYNHKGEIVKEYPLPLKELISLFTFFGTLDYRLIKSLDMQFDQKDLGKFTIDENSIEEILLKLKKGEYPKVYAVFVRGEISLFSLKDVEKLRTGLEIVYAECFSHREQKVCREMVITQKGAHKGRTLQEVKKINKKKKTVHIGDYYNDLSGFNCADSSFILGEYEVEKEITRVKSVQEALLSLSLFN